MFNRIDSVDYEHRTFHNELATPKFPGVPIVHAALVLHRAQKLLGLR